MTSGAALDLDALGPRLPSPLLPVGDERFARRGLRLLLKRDDLIHPALVGNKFRKLTPSLRAAGGRTLLTFGGAYSNHLRATAAAGRLLGLPTVGVVRGHELAARPLNPSLARCAADGMRLHFIDRSTYRRKAEPEVLASILREVSGGTHTTDAHTTDPDATGPGARACGDGGQDRNGVLVVPEGGSNALAVRNCVALGRELDGVADVVGIACGTGGTLAGMAAGLGAGQRAIGFPVLRGGFLGAEVDRLQYEAFGGPRGNWRLDDRFHGGGYARSTPELDAFAEDFERRHGIPLERLYVAKMLYGLTTLAGEGAFPAGTSVAAVITGSPDQPLSSR
ncbi:1-aminocyclopropane-1-carboxylate deaminase/D-cysteine desulfhydrase [Streptomyces sp. GC420]|uniref:1-aminocyclopropane-1-carboxylate deaminase/D-cysteine desulfhydrase n=1 Tax=Streptomyces sp. GC420 TaxID=2697568 RepID=UPI001414D823|nr:pyridoxal-phosphate dependent enzyme [Streptomyces sp. GC420]NBM15620.1 pyridoxal-phosphate dependent enzyme [Streptomyces sp. GC420]